MPIDPLGRVLLKSSVLLIAVLGCSAPLGSGAVYRGAREPARVSADQIRESASAEPDDKVIGEVSASCTSKGQRRTIHDEWLSDIDCSEARLKRALREQAAQHGGDALIGVDCHSHGGSERRVSRCAAQVARRAGSLDHVEKRADWAVSGEPRASDAWRIRVTFWPARGEPAALPARHSELVREVEAFPVNDRRLGAIVACCRSGCSRSSVRAAVRIAASSLGANDVVGVHCLERDEAWICAGTAAAYKVDPRQDARAR
jgi:hypothetical protein